MSFCKVRHGRLSWDARYRHRSPKPFVFQGSSKASLFGDPQHSSLSQRWFRSLFSKVHSERALKIGLSSTNFAVIEGQ